MQAVTFELETGVLVEDGELPYALRDWPEEEPTSSKEYADPCEALYAFEREDLSELPEDIIQSNGERGSIVTVGSYASINRLEWEDRQSGALSDAYRLVLRMRERRCTAHGEGTVIISARQGETFECEWECNAGSLAHMADLMARDRGASSEEPHDSSLIPISTTHGVVLAAPGKPGSAAQLPRGDAPKLALAMAAASGGVMVTKVIRSNFERLGLRTSSCFANRFAYCLVSDGAAERVGRGRYKLLR